MTQSLAARGGPLRVAGEEAVRAQVADAVHAMRGLGTVAVDVHVADPHRV